MLLPVRPNVELVLVAISSVSAACLAICSQPEPIYPFCTNQVLYIHSTYPLAHVVTAHCDQRGPYGLRPSPTSAHLILSMVPLPSSYHLEHLKLMISIRFRLCLDHQLAMIAWQPSSELLFHMPRRQNAA